MQLNEMIEKLNYRDGQYPKEFIEYILANREEFTPLLIDILRKTTTEAETYANDGTYLAHLPALAILAYFREKSAFPVVIDFLKIKPENIDLFLEDFITESLDSVIASVYNGDLKTLEDFVFDDKSYEWCRIEALNSFIVLFNEGVINRDELLKTFSKFFTGLKKESSTTDIWTSLVDACWKTHLTELIPQIQKAYEDNLINDLWIGDFNTIMKEFETGYDNSLCKNFINDVELEIGYFYANRNNLDDEDGDFIEDLFDDDALDDYDLPPLSPLSIPHQDTYVRVSQKVGRNDPCPCGSGKKYKKCCGA